MPIPVSTFMTRETKSVAPQTVVSTMALRKLGSAVVVDGGRPIGIFTTTDALRAFASLLRGEQDREREAALRAAYRLIGR